MSGAASVTRPEVADARLIVVFDSGLGGLTVYREIVKRTPQAAYLYVADDAAFPYGRLDEDAVSARVGQVMARLFERVRPDIVVLACNTASTSALAHVRAMFPTVDFVGVVPAIKPAAQLSRSGLITVLGTSGTVRRDYTRGLIAEHAAHCAVTLVGSEHLAGLAEADAHGREVSDEALVAELEPCFVESEGRRTDHIVLACTHYPLLRRRFERLAGSGVGWPVTFIDPAPAIARRAEHVLSLRAAARLRAPASPMRQVWTTSGSLDAAAGRLFSAAGLTFSGGFSCPFPACTYPA